jgi:hypothetical protein
VPQRVQIGSSRGSLIEYVSRASVGFRASDEAQRVLVEQSRRRKSQSVRRGRGLLAENPMCRPAAPDVQLRPLESDNGNGAHAPHRRCVSTPGLKQQPSGKWIDGLDEAEAVKVGVARVDPFDPVGRV